jgi:peroxiredoxin
MSKHRCVLAVVAGFTVVSAVNAATLPRQAPELTVNMVSAKPIQISAYKGKVVLLAFILTTCPHCQNTTGFLIKEQSEYGPRGLQVIESAIQEGAAALVPAFIKQFNTPFPVGFNNYAEAAGFMEHPPMLIMHMPGLVFIDRQGMIRAQYEGDNEKFFGEQQGENLKKQIESLLNEGAPASKKNVSGKKTAATAKKAS